MRTRDTGSYIAADHSQAAVGTANVRLAGWCSAAKVEKNSARLSLGYLILLGAHLGSRSRTRVTEANYGVGGEVSGGGDC